MSVKLLIEHHLELLSLKGGYTGSSESTLVKMPHCWKSHVTAQYIYAYFDNRRKIRVCVCVLKRPANSHLSSKDGIYSRDVECW